jgi:CubicO group peptidase (beta-lactamase class C family)
MSKETAPTVFGETQAQFDKVKTFDFLPGNSGAARGVFWVAADLAKQGDTPITDLVIRSGRL